MWMLALGNYCKYIKRNLFLAFQISVLLFIGIIMMATLHKEMKLYRPVSDFQGKEGVLYSNYGYHQTDKMALTEGVDDVDKVLTYGCAPFYFGDENQWISSVVYSAELVDEFQGELKEGRWPEKESEKTEVVITENNCGWQIGDTIVLKYISNNGESEKSIEVKVCGLLQEGATIFGRYFGDKSEYHYDYRDLYSTYRFKQELQPLLFFLEEQLVKESIYPDYGYEYLISFKEGISKEKAEANIERILENGEVFTYGSAMGSILKPLNEFMDSTRKELIRNLMMYIPLLVCLLLVTIISVVNVSVLTARENYRQYAVFYLLGLHWKRCGVLAVIQSGITIFLSVILTVFYISFVYLFRLRQYLYINIHEETIIFLVVLLGLLLGVSMVIPVKMLRKRQPIDILKRERM